MTPLHLLLPIVLMAAAPAFAQVDAGARVAEAQKVIESGNLAAGLEALKATVEAAPKSFEARLELGRALDLEGQHDAARVQLEEALKLASDENRNEALTALGISHAFQSRADEAARYYQRAFDARMQADDPRGAAGLSNALGRIYLESGNLAKAEEWYTTGYETSRKIPGLSAQESALWEMRRHNALGRIAARRGDRAAAGKHAAEAKALLDKGGNENQRVFYPYLLGYIAFASKDYRTAIEELKKGSLEDPFVLGLIGQAHQQLGERDAAAEHFRKVLAIHDHSIGSAFARPRARAFLR